MFRTSTMFLKKYSFLHKHFNFKLNINLLHKIMSFNFNTNTPAPAGAQGQVQTPPAKTKEQLKVEALMNQWPEILRNPPKDSHLQEAKEFYEDLYKYHQGDKKYMGPLDLPKQYARDFVEVVNQTFTTDAIADFFQQYEGFLPDHFIMGKFKQIALTHKDKSPELYDIILPQVKKLILNADRQTARNLHIAVVSGSYLNLDDAEYWDMIEYKLNNERLHRYLSVKEASEVAFHLVSMRKGSKALIQQLEVYFIKHRKAVHMDKNIMKMVSGAFSVCGCSPTLIAALEDPNIEVPEIDPKIPKMDKVPYGDSKRAAITGNNNKQKQISPH